MQRIVVVGTSGSGKSTLARRIETKLGTPLTELDDLHWLPNWQKRPLEDFRARVDAVTSTDSWVISGNYSMVRDLIWPHADTLIWLDYSLTRVILPRLIFRTFKRLITQEQIFKAGNKERWSNFLSLNKDKSIIMWAIDTHPKHRLAYPQAFTQPEHAHLHVLRFRTPREAEEWLQNLA